MTSKKLSATIFDLSCNWHIFNFQKNPDADQINFPPYLKHDKKITNDESRSKKRCAWISNTCGYQIQGVHMLPRKGRSCNHWTLAERNFIRKVIWEHLLPIISCTANPKAGLEQGRLWYGLNQGTENNRITFWRDDDKWKTSVLVWENLTSGNKLFSSNYRVSANFRKFWQCLGSRRNGWNSIHLFYRDLRQYSGVVVMPNYYTSS